MNNKQEVLNSVLSNSKATYSKYEVQQLLESIKVCHTPPKYFKKGDIIILKPNNGASGSKVRPSVVIKVLEETLVVLPMTTTNDHMVLSPGNSRFNTGYFSKSMTTITKEFASERFGGVFDNTKVLNKAIKALKEYINKI